MIIVTNGYKSGWLSENKIYIGRHNKKFNLIGSVLANPFTIGKDGTREEVVEKYRKWLNEEVRKQGNTYRYLVNLARLHQSPDVFEVVCYCKPQLCHGDIVIRALEYILSTLGNNNEITQ